MERVLVTGAAGFLGWNLVEYLLSHDFFVEAVVRPNSPRNVRLLRTFSEEMRAALAPMQQISYGASERPPTSMRPSVEKIQTHTGWRACVKFADGVKITY